MIITGNLGNITNFNPTLFYIIENNTFRFAPENHKDSKPCLIDTGFFGNLILPNTRESRRISTNGFFLRSNLLTADLTSLDVYYTLGYIDHRVFFDKIKMKVALADIPRAIIGMQVLKEFHEVTFDFKENDVRYNLDTHYIPPTKPTT